jgi:SAM-dependent methyltransferase
MFTSSVLKLFHSLGYEIHKIRTPPDETLSRRRAVFAEEPRSLDPIWPLPRLSNGFSDHEIREEFAKYKLWFFPYEFEGGISFPSSYKQFGGQKVASAKRHLRRFKHFMPYVMQAQNHSLKGKRVLDIACNSGFWSLQCALLGAEVVGFDARAELIEQANLVKSIVGLNNVEFKVLDFWDMSPQSLGGTFDIVLNLGILYHLADPVGALKRTKLMAKENILVDTAVYPAKSSLMRLRWEDPIDIRTAVNPGVVIQPSKSSMELMLQHIGVSNWFEIPVRTRDMPRDYLRLLRASWLVDV